MPACRSPPTHLFGNLFVTCYSHRLCRTGPCSSSFRSSRRVVRTPCGCTTSEQPRAQLPRPACVGPPAPHLPPGVLCASPARIRCCQRCGTFTVTAGCRVNFTHPAARPLRGRQGRFPGPIARRERAAVLGESRSPKLTSRAKRLRRRAIFATWGAHHNAPELRGAICAKAATNFAVPVERLGRGAGGGRYLI